jgi:hypothetical protein
MEAYHNAIAATLPQHKAAILAMIPLAYRDKVQ